MQGFWTKHSPSSNNKPEVNGYDRDDMALKAERQRQLKLLC